MNENIDKVYFKLPKNPEVATPSSTPAHTPVYFKQGEGPAVQSDEYNVDLDEFSKYLGKSGGTFINDPEVMNESRAQVQTKGAKLAMFVPRVLGKTLTEIAKMPGYVGGAANWIADGADSDNIGMMVDNGWTQAMESVDESIKSLLPVHTRRVVEEGNVWRQLISPEFWATDAADGLGFLAAYLMPGAALKSIGIGTKIARGLKATAKTAAKIDLGLATVTNTVLEAAAEAGGVVQDLKKFYSMAIAEGLTNPATGRVYTEKDATEAIGIAGQNAFLTNTVLLMGPNYLMNKNVIGAFGIGKKEAQNIIGQAAAKEAGVAVKGTRGIAMKRLMASIASEGFFEEGMQTATTNLFTNRAKGTKVATDDLIGELMDEYAEMMTTTDGQKSVLLGSILGGVGGVVGGIREQHAKTRNVSNLSDLLNQNFEGTLAAFMSSYETEEDGSLKLVEGMPVANYDKFVNNAKNNLGEEMTSYMLDYYAKEGRADEYYAMANDVLTRFALPYLHQEGGLEAMEAKLAELDPSIAAQVAQLEGGKEIEEFKREWKSRSAKLQKVYDKIATYDNDFYKIDAKTAEEKSMRNQFIHRLHNNAIIEASREFFFDTQIAKREMEILENKSINAENLERVNAKLEKQIEGMKKLRDIAIKNQKLIYNKKQQQATFEAEVDKKTKLQDDMANAPKPEDQSSEEIDALLKNHTRKSVTIVNNEEKIGTESDELEIDMLDEKGEVVTNEVLLDEDKPELGKKPLTNKYKIAGRSRGSLVFENVDSGHRVFLRPDGSISYQLDKSGEAPMITSKLKRIQQVLKEGPAPIVFDEKDPHTPFFDDTSFETTTGNLEAVVAVINDPTASAVKKGEAHDALRWFAFQDAYKVSEKPEQVLTTMSLRQVKALLVNDPIREQLRFWVPSLKLSLTVEELAYHTPEVQATAEEDIKLVVQTRVVSEGKESFVPYTMDSRLVWNSLPTASWATDRGVQRFSTKTIESILKEDVKAKLLSGREPVKGSEEELQVRKEVDRLLKEKKEQAIATHKQRREAYKTTSQTYYISVKHPGKRVALPTGQNTNDIVGSIITEEQIPTARLEYTSKGKGTYPINIEGRDFLLTSGKVHIWNATAGTLEELDYRNMNAQEIETYIGLLKALKEDVMITRDGQTRKINAMDRMQIVQFLNIMTPFNSKEGQYRYDVSTGFTTGEFRHVKFGAEELTYEDILENGPKMAAFREFLSDKRFGVKYAELKIDEDFKEFAFTENGVEVITWDRAQGGYKAFLFSTKGDRAAKLTCKVRSKLSQDPVENAKTPQYLSGKVGLKPYGKRVVAEPVMDKPAAKPVAKPVEAPAPQPIVKKFGIFEHGVPYVLSITREDGSKGNFDGVKLTWNNQTNKFTYEGAEDAVASAKSNLNRVFSVPEPSLAKAQAAFGEHNAKFDILRVEISKPQTATTLSKADIDAAVQEIQTETGKVISQQMMDGAMIALKQNPGATKDLFKIILRSILNPGVNVPSRRTSTKRMRTNLSSEPLVDMDLKYLEELFPEFDMAITPLEGNTGGMVIDSMQLLLAPRAAEGTQYHEAYHVVSLAFMTPRQRNKLYNELRMRTGKTTMTDVEAEEFLAEEFRLYKLSGGSYTFGTGQRQKQNWFEKLVSLLTRLMQKLRLFTSIEDTFSTLDAKPYLSKDRKSKVEGTFKKKLGGLSEAASNALLENLHFEFFDSVFGNEDVNYSDLVANPDQLKDTYTNIALSMLEYKNSTVRTAENANEYDLVEHTLNNWDTLQAQHIKFLHQNGIEVTPIKKIENTEKVDEVEETAETKIESKDSLGIADPHLTDVKLLMPTPVKLLLMSLPVSDRLVQGEDVDYVPRGSQVDGFTYYRMEQYTKMVNYLHSNLAGISSYPRMVQKLKSLENQNHPEIGVLISRLRSWFENYTPTPDQRALQTAFFVQFCKTKETPIITFLRSSGDIVFLDAVVGAISERISNEWRNNVRQEAGTPKSAFKRNSRDELIIDLEQLITLDKEKSYTLTQLKSNAKLKVGLTAGQNLSFLRSFGMNVTQKENPLVDNAKLSALVHKIINDVTAETSLDDLYSKDVMAINKEITDVLEIAVEQSTDVQDLQFLNADNKTQYSIALRSYVSQLVDLLNEDNIPSELIPADRGGKNISTVGNTIVNSAMDGRKTRVVLLSATKTETSDNESTAALNFTDLITTSFGAILNGYFPFMRAGDRTMEYALDMLLTKEERDAMYRLDRKGMYAILSQHLINEVATVFAHKYGLGKDLKNFSKNGGKLRIFDFGDFITDADLQEYYQKQTVTDNSEFGKDIAGSFLAMAKGFVVANRAKVAQLFDTMLKEETAASKQMLLDAGVIVETQSGKFQPVGINMESIAKILGNRITELDESQLSKVIEFGAFRYLQGAIEQTQVFVGDIAGYAKSSDVPKRAKAASSSKKGQRVDPDNLAALSESHPRWSGAYSENVRMHVVADSSIPLSMRSTKDYNDVLGEGNAYEVGFDIADGQSKSTLDFHRQILLQENSWSEAQEKTYQWEHQLLALRLRKLEAITENQLKGLFSTVFAQHTNGEVPSVPMYKGKPINYVELGIIPILKPQGYGPLANDEGSFITTKFNLKTSVAPIFPSMLKDNSPMLIYYLSMLNRNTDMVVFGSAAKMETLVLEDFYDGEGNMTRVTDESRITEVSYDYIGIQQDIEPEVHDNVTNSTQKRKLEATNLYSVGQAVKDENDKPYVGTLKDEQIALTTELSQRQWTRLVTELGLTKTEDGYILDTTNAESVAKFRKLLKAEFERRLMPDNAIDGIDVVTSSDQVLFDTLFIKGKIQQVLNSLVRNRVISLKTNGDMMIQESSIGYDEELAFYQYKKGMRRISKAEVMISLPKDWIPLVEQAGGLDAFNALIAARKYRQAGIDPRLLEFSANRIPSQGLNSLEVFRVKKFLPFYAGSRIVLPAAIVVKSGSDFDVDKLTCYLPNYEMKGATPRYIEMNSKVTTGEQSSKALENRLNEVSMELLLIPQNFRLLITPNTAATLEAYADKYGGADKQTAYTATELVLWSTNMKISRAFWAGREMISLAAIHNVSHAISQRAPVRIEDPAVQFWFEGQEIPEGESITMGHITDKSGRTISENFAEFLSAYVDVAKKPFVFFLNANKVGFPVFSFLNRFSVTAPVDMETISAFMTQPIITRFMTEYEKSRSMLMKTAKNREDMSVEMDESIEKIYNALSKEFGNGPKYENSLAKLYRDYYNAVKGSKKRETLLTEINELKAALDYPMLNVKQLKDTLGIGILDQFLVYREFGKQLDAFHQVTRPDGSYPKTMGGAVYHRHKLQQVRKVGFFATEDIDRFLNDTELKPFHDAWENNTNLYGSFFLTGNGAMSELVDHVIKVYDDQFGMDVEYVLDRFENDFVNYIIHTRTELSAEPFFPRPLNEEYERLVMGESSVASRMPGMRAQVGDNYLMKELYEIFNAKLGRRDERTETENIKLFMRKYTAQEVNQLVNGFNELFDSQDPAVKQFAVDLAELAIVQNGFTRTPLNFTDIIPNTLIQPIFRAIIAKYQSEVAGMSQAAWAAEKDHVFNSFLMVNYRDKRIVPRMNFYQMSDSVPEEIYRNKHYHYGKIATTSTLTAFDYLTYEVDAVDLTTKAALQKAGKPVPRKIVIYKKDPVPEKYGFNTYFIYRAVSDGKGEGIYLKEFYAEEHGSVLASNGGMPKIVKPAAKTDIEEEFKYAPQYALHRSDNRESDSELNTAVKTFLAGLGIPLEPVMQILDEKGMSTDYIAVADLATRTVKFVEGKIGIAELPEEAAHWYVELLGADNPVYQKMMRDITGYKEYRDVVESDYAKVYNADDMKLRKEAVGKLIAKYMVGEYTDAKIQSWWKAIWNKLVRLFRGFRNDPYAAAAHQILINKINELTVAPEAVESTDAFYSKATNQRRSDAYQASLEASIRERRLKEAEDRKNNKVTTVQEVNKHAEESKDSVDAAAMEILNNFEKYFPDYADFSNEERTAFVKMMSEGQIEIYC